MQTNVIDASDLFKNKMYKDSLKRLNILTKEHNRLIKESPETYFNGALEEIVKLRTTLDKLKDTLEDPYFDDDSLEQVTVLKMIIEKEYN